MRLEKMVFTPLDLESRLQDIKGAIMRKFIMSLIAVGLFFYQPIYCADDNFYDDIMRFDNTFTKIHQFYVKKIDADTLVSAGIRGMCQILDGDSYVISNSENSNTAKSNNNKGFNRLPFQSTIINNNIAYFCPIQINDQTLVEANKFVINLKNFKTDGFILDLRYTNGGYLDKCAAMAGIFLEKNKIICYTKGRDDKQIQCYKAKENTAISLQLPIVVLVNKMTSSGSELIASALRENKKATIIGDTTAGIAHISTMMPIDKNRALKLTTAYIYSPSWKCLNNDKNGLIPDICVNAEDDCFCKNAVLRSGLSFQYLSDTNNNSKGIKYFINFISAKMTKDMIIQTLSVYSPLLANNKEIYEDRYVKHAISNILLERVISDMGENQNKLQSILTSLCLKNYKLKEALSENDIQDPCVIASLKIFKHN